jgi:nucleoside-diphosphate-sugar epimerase
MVILLTGGTGFVGRHIVKSLANDPNNTIYILSRNKVVDGFKGDHKNVFYRSISYESIDELSIFFKKVNPSHILHLASSKSRNKLNELNYDLFIKDISVDINIINAALTIKTLSAFIYLGSADMFMPSEKNITEELNFQPTNSYALKKAIITNLIFEFRKSKNFPGVVVIPSLIYGPMQKEEMFLPALIKSLIKNKSFNMSHGEQYRDYIYIDDFVEAIYLLIIKNIQTKPILLIGSGESVKIIDVAQKVLNFFDSKSKSLIKVGNKELVNSSIDYNFDISNSSNYLNWKPKYSFDKGLIKTIDYFMVENNA